MEGIQHQGLDSLYHMLKPRFHCPCKRVHRQMRLKGIYFIRHHAYKTTSNSNHKYPRAPDLQSETSILIDQIRLGSLILLIFLLVKVGFI